MQQILCPLLTLCLIAVLLRVVFSWFPMSGGGVMATVQDVLITITEPVLGPLRRVLPRPGGIPLDLSPLVVFLAILVLQGLLGC